MQWEEKIANLLKKLIPSPLTALIIFGLTEIFFTSILSQMIKNHASTEELVNTALIENGMLNILYVIYIFSVIHQNVNKLLDVKGSYEVKMVWLAFYILHTIVSLIVPNLMLFYWYCYTYHHIDAPEIKALYYGLLKSVGCLY